MKNINIYSFLKCRITMLFSFFILLSGCQPGSNSSNTPGNLAVTTIDPCNFIHAYCIDKNMPCELKGSIDTFNSCVCDNIAQINNDVENCLTNTAASSACTISTSFELTCPFDYKCELVRTACLTHVESQCNVNATSFASYPNCICNNRSSIEPAYKACVSSYSSECGTMNTDDFDTLCPS